MPSGDGRAAANARQKRYRDRQKKHAAGDHGECNPRSCDEASGVVYLDEEGLNEAGGDGVECVTRDVTAPLENLMSHREPPAGLRDRGRRLWEEMAGLKLGPTHVLLLERACRMADRCERLDGQLEGRDWLELVEVPGTDGGVVRVVVDRALSEIRQHEIALKLLVAELRHAGRPATPSVGSPPVAGGEKPEGVSEGAKRGGLAAIRNDWSAGS